MTWGEGLDVLRERGHLRLKPGDLVSMNPRSMLNGGGLALVTSVCTEKALKGMYEVYYIKGGYETMADDVLDILEVVSRSKNRQQKG